MESGIHKITSKMGSSLRKQTRNHFYKPSAKKEIVAQSFSYDENFRPIVEGLILKKTMNHSWKSRYFCLTWSRLLYFASPSKKEIKGCFNLSSLKDYDVFLSHDDNQLILRLVVFVSSKNSSVKVEKQLIELNFFGDQLRYLTWKSGVEQVLARLYRFDRSIYYRIPNHLVISPNQKLCQDNFWNRIYITNEELLSYGDNLDILLCRSKNWAAGLQRVLMGAHFDHVALLLRDSNNQLLVLEAIESRGVWMNPWNQMVQTFKDCYEEMAYRKITFPENTEMNMEMLQFYLQSVIGNHYELSLSKLLLCEEDQTQDTSRKSRLQLCLPSISSKKNIKDKTFFCSELVADIYIKMGFLKGKKRNEYWPKDFQNEIKFGLKAQLSPLMYIAL